MDVRQGYEEKKTDENIFDGRVKCIRVRGTHHFITTLDIFQTLLSMFDSSHCSENVCVLFIKPNEDEEKLQMEETHIRKDMECGYLKFYICLCVCIEHTLKSYKMPTNGETALISSYIISSIIYCAESQAYCKSCNVCSTYIKWHELQHDRKNDDSLLCGVWCHWNGISLFAYSTFGVRHFRIRLG